MDHHQTGFTDFARANNEGFRPEELDVLARRVHAVMDEVAAMTTEATSSDAQKPGRFVDHAASKTTPDAGKPVKASSFRLHDSQVRVEDFTLDNLKLEDFEVKEQVGSGMCSTVHHAVHINSGSHVALKCYRMSELSVVSQHHVKREIAMHSRLKHSNITSLYGSFEDSKGNVYLVLEYAKKGDLFESLYKECQSLSEEEICNTIICPTASALVYMHEKGIIHRDIKPENLMMGDSMFGTEVKLADFGFAVDCKSSTPMSRLGTIDYMAPEVIECDAKRRAELSATGQAGYGPQVDCWALGVLAYECLFRRTPFPSGDMQVVYEAIQEGSIGLPKRKISPEGMDFILSCLDVEPKTRITAKEMLDHPWLRKNERRVSMDTMNKLWDSDVKMNSPG